MDLYGYSVSKIRPPDINTEPTVETDEVKKIQEILRDSIESNHKDDEFLKKVFILESVRNQMLD